MTQDNAINSPAKSLEATNRLIRFISYNHQERFKYRF